MMMDRCKGLIAWLICVMVEGLVHAAAAEDGHTPHHSPLRAAPPSPAPSTRAPPAPSQHPPEGPSSRRPPSSSSMPAPGQAQARSAPTPHSFPGPQVPVFGAANRCAPLRSGWLVQSGFRRDGVVRACISCRLWQGLLQAWGGPWCARPACVAHPVEGLIALTLRLACACWVCILLRGSAASTVAVLQHTNKHHILLHLTDGTRSCTLSTWEYV